MTLTELHLASGLSRQEFNELVAEILDVAPVTVLQWYYKPDRASAFKMNVLEQTLRTRGLIGE